MSEIICDECGKLIGTHPLAFVNQVNAHYIGCLLTQDVVELRHQLKQMTAERDALKEEVKKWQEWLPSDEDLRELAEQARSRNGTYTNGLAAQCAYIGGLQARLRQRDSERDALREQIIEASSAYNLNGHIDTIDETLGLVRMCHEGAQALKENIELHARLEVAMEAIDYATKRMPALYEVRKLNNYRSEIECIGKEA